jgi:antitoxin VapB
MPKRTRLPRALAKATGETMTRAVKQALHERLARVRNQRLPRATVEDLLAIGRRCAAQIKGEPVDPTHLLYDKRGLTAIVIVTGALR